MSTTAPTTNTTKIFSQLSDKPADNLVENLEAKSAEQSVEISVEISAEESAEVSAEKQIEKLTESTAETIAEPHTETDLLDNGDGNGDIDLSPNDHDAASIGYTIVQVALNRPLFSTFDYKVKGFFSKEILGSRIQVSFGHGRSASKEIAIVVGIGAQSTLPLTKIKEGKLLDTKPLIGTDVFETLLYGARYYHYPLGQVMPLALPKHLRDGGTPTYKEIPGIRATLEKVVLSDQDRDRSEQTARALSETAGDDAKAREALFQKEFARELQERRLAVAMKALRSKGQKALLTELLAGPRKRRELKEQGFSSQQEQALVRRGFAQHINFATEVEAFNLKRCLEEGASAGVDPILASQPLPLNTEQEQVLAAILQHPQSDVFVLNGVTGSGKTEVYLQAIEATLRQGLKAMVLVPEIALTPQTFRRFYTRFKVPIATIHSTLSSRERLDAFLDMNSGRAAILIGTRSALFTTIPDLGLIVIDEEHDSSFKQADNFRYHTRTLAEYRARLCKCKLLLGSATPSLESIYHVQMGHYLRLDMLTRAKNSKLPHVEVVDLRHDDYTDGVDAGIGSVLEDAIGITTAKHHQALLFLNRRGFSHSMVCHNCGRVVTCPHCDTQLTVHRSVGELRCHICNTAIKIPKVCPYCHEDTLFETGLGTEQVETYLRSRFMDVGVERIDRDNITSKADLEEALARIVSHRSEILIGTQMLAKGHDFPDVTLVGILDIDAGLFCDDYRGLEYTAQLITQVAGRAGRADHAGKVYIQTRFPEHQLIMRLIAPDFNYYALGCELLDIRRQLHLPPYSYQALVMTNSQNRELSFNTLKALFSAIEDRNDLIANLKISPILSDRVEKRFNRYHFHVLITAIHQSDLHRLLDELVYIFSNMKTAQDLRFAIDVDPIIMI